MLFTATPPHASTRTLTRTHFLDWALSRESDLGCSPAHPAGGLSLVASPSSRTHRLARGLPWRVSRWRTPSLCHLGPGFPVRHARHCSLPRAGARRTLRHKVRLCHAFCAPSPPERAHVDTTHTQRPPLSRAVLPREPSRQDHVGMPSRTPLIPWAEPRTAADRGPTSLWVDCPALGFSGPLQTRLNSARALPSLRPGSTFQLVLISLHGFVPRGTAFNPAPIAVLRGTLTPTPSPASPAAGGPFHEFEFPCAPPNSRPCPGGSAPGIS